jgi:small-conductance mechanosensitive channel
MFDLNAIQAQVEGVLPMLFWSLVILAVAFVVYKAVTMLIRRALLRGARTKDQKNNALAFLSIWKYSFTIIVVMGLVFYFGGDITGLGIWAGLMTAALGWALQRPITGIAGWIMVVVKRPFRVGDRIMIGSVKGDVININLTHIHLKEVGGTIASEETSGRVIMIPNSKLFEMDIINYTLTDDFILDEVVTTVTYESDIDNAVRICEEAVKKVTKDFVADMPKPPAVRTFFQPSGIDCKTRYYVRAEDRIKVSSDLTREIFRGVSRDRKVEIAYPHTEVVLRKKALR